MAPDSSSGTSAGGAVRVRVESTACAECCNGEWYRHTMVPPDLQALLSDARTVAVVGCSPRPGRAANFVPQYLHKAGLRIVPVNPHHEELMGERCFPDLASVPEEISIDIVDIFRRPEFVPDVVREVVHRAQRTGERPLVFTQIGVHHPEGQRIAEDAGLPYVADRCLMVDYRAAT